MSELKWEGTNISASNGMIHVIDVVLLPLSIADIDDTEGDFWTFWRSFS